MRHTHHTTRVVSLGSLGVNPSIFNSRGDSFARACVCEREMCWGCLEGFGGKAIGEICAVAPSPLLLIDRCRRPPLRSLLSTSLSVVCVWRRIYFFLLLLCHLFNCKCLTCHFLFSRHSEKKECNRPFKYLGHIFDWRAPKNAHRMSFIFPSCCCRRLFFSFLFWSRHVGSLKVV